MAELPSDQRVIITGMPTGIIPYPRIRITLNSVPIEVRISEEDFQKLVEAGMWTKIS